ncbi:MAG TPA: T9SS type A sorting domain-containing protein [Candidatus Kapabacteria bacterium]|nr:T9SS type A sorting domain-containing protein [Candidatus Kapabacteria bacterium]
MPAGKTYNYITIGNFQNDIDLYFDLEDIQYYGRSTGQAYYFIDSVSVYPIDATECECVSMLVPIEINKYVPSNDSTQCCYEYKIIIPDSSAKWTYSLCNVHKIQIRKGEEILVEEIAAESEDFAGMNFYGSFCVEKFNTSNNEFTIVFFTRNSNGDYIPLERCTKVMKLNCVCDCSNFSDYPHPKNKATLELIKVDSSASGRCCWDIVLKNPFTNDSTSCEYDLSGQFLFVNSNLLLNDYDFSAPFIIKPGEEIILGSVCSNGIPPEQYQNQTINFILSTDSLSSSGCDTVAKKVLACDTTLLCCDNWKIRLDTLKHFIDDHLHPQWRYCGTYLYLYYFNTVDYCNLNDTFNVSLTSSNNIVSQEFDLVPATLSSGEIINISPYMIFEDSLRACVKIINKRTLDTCERCTTVYCLPNIILPDNMEQGGGELLKNSIGDLPEELNIIKIAPHPIEDNFEIQLLSNKKELSQIKIFDLMGIEVYSIDYYLIEGFNKISVNNLDLSNGTYLLTITTDNKIKSSKIQIMR